MPKKLATDEIDLLNAFTIIWKGKWSIVLIIAIGLTLTFLNTSKPKIGKNVKIKSVTEIRPIQVIDEAKYKMFSSVLDIIGGIKSAYTDQNIYGSRKKAFIEMGILTIEQNYKTKENTTYKITRDFLYTLFTDMLKNGSYLESAIKKFRLIK